MHYRIVVNDVEKAHAFERGRYRDAFLKAGVSADRVERVVDERVGQARHKGTVHAEMSDACPEGKPNCRHCGDPAFAGQCKAAGHCPDCGTKHGIAPDSVLAAHGFALEG